MEMRQRQRQMQLQQFRTPQHPSSKVSYWANEPQQFRTPQHPSMGTNHRDVAESWQGTHQNWDGDQPQNPAAFGTNHWSGEPPQFRTPQHPSSSLRKNYWGTVGGTRQFGTPQHPSAFREFRTPQHPSQGTNDWGGASPLLARNIPQESLDKRYEKLNAIRAQDEIFTPPAMEGDDDFLYWSKVETPNYLHEFQPTANQNPSRRRGLLWKFIKKKPRDQNPTVLGNSSEKKKRWFPKLDMQKRWPNGWH